MEELTVAEGQATSLLGNSLRNCIRQDLSKPFQ